MEPAKNSFYQYNYNDLQTIFKENGLSPSGLDLLFTWHYNKKNDGHCVIDLAKKTQHYLIEHFDFHLPEIEKTQESEDRTVKFLIKLHDGMKVETVLIPFQNKYTICLSSQVGCAMKCSFCFTGTQGLKRNLKTEEIVGQFIIAARWLKKERPGGFRIRNIVFMGQGEPLHNFDATKKATEIFLHPRGISIAALRITVSTVGYLPGLKRWEEEMPGVNIALSLHSPFSEKRNKLIPLNQTYPLPEILSYLKKIPLKRKQFVTYEYLLIKNYNESEEDAHATAQLLKDQRAIINLIPFNPFPGPSYERPEKDKVLEFQKIMASYGLPTMIRGTKGDDILAACGQLNTST